MTHQEHAHDDDSTLGRLYRQLNRVAALREQMRAHQEDLQDRDRLRQWQADRLGRTHRDLLESDRYGPAAEFFLTDLYGPGDCARRDADVMRVMPTAERLLPESGLKVLAQAIELDALSEELDYLMVVALRRIDGIDPITPDHYTIAYRAVGEQVRRETSDCVGERAWHDAGQAGEKAAAGGNPQAGVRARPSGGAWRALLLCRAWLSGVSSDGACQRVSRNHRQSRDGAHDGAL